MSGKITIKEDVSGKLRSVDYWVTAKGNLAWRFNDRVYVKLAKTGYIMMCDKDSNNWVPSDVHTKARVQNNPRPEKNFEFIDLPNGPTRPTIRLIG